MFPENILNESQLDQILSQPSEAVIELIKRIQGDIIILGIAGKMGVNLARMLKQALELSGVRKKLYGVSRFSQAGERKRLESLEIETIQCDLIDHSMVARLPLVENVIFMAGKKFGTVDMGGDTWAINTIAPSNIANHFRGSKIVAFSTGNVYDLVPVGSSGASESDSVKPVGEYAMSALGRERLFEFNSEKNRTAVCLIRLNYANDLRYGVLRDIGDQVFAGQPVDVSMGYVNVIWQGDAINQSILCLDHCKIPPHILNITGPETVSVRYIAKQFARLFSKKVIFKGDEQPTALLSNSARAAHLFGYPTVPLLKMIQWQAKWIEIGGRSLNKETHFQIRDGNF
jgi:nucleoside-diphosphate-sugar epimerase